MDQRIRQSFDLLNRKFSILDGQKDKWFFIIFSGAFATIFLVIYNPLNINDFYINTRLGTLVSIKSAGIIAAIILAFSQFILRPIFQLERHTIGTFILWLFFELILISIFLSLVYGEVGQPYSQEFIITLENTFLLGILPYGASCILLALYQSNKNSEIPVDFAMHPNEFVTLEDENGKDILTVRSMDLIYLKAENNYVSATYLRNGKIKKILIRNNLKSLEHQLNNSNILRIHRSYMVNKANINSVSRKGRQMVIQMNHIDGNPLPVSSSYRSSLSTNL